jgi:flagellin
MASILTNTSAMGALSTLRSISASMEDTQSRISSGLKVGSASDNAAYWSIATTMKSDNMALSAVSDALGLGAAKVDTAYSGMESAIDVVKQIKTKLVAATEDGVDKTKIQEEIGQLQDQLTSIAEAASFSGENWLQADLTGGTDLEKSVVASFVRDDSGNVSVKKVDYTLSTDNVLFDSGGNTGILDNLNSIDGNGISVNVNVNGTVDAYDVVRYTTAEVVADGATFDADGIAASGGSVSDGYVKVDDDTWVAAIDQTNDTTIEIFTEDSTGALWAVDTGNTSSATMNVSVSDFEIDNSTSTTQLEDLIQMVDDALTSMTSAASSLGSISSRIETQESFVSDLSDSIEAGVGRLVDADMNEESTRLKALQTQQQLAIQALSIANSDSQNVLSLFR